MKNIVIKTQRAQRANSYFSASTINRAMQKTIDEAIKSDFLNFKRTCKRICTDVPKRKHPLKTHRNCNIRAPHKKTSSKCSDTSSSDPDGAAHSYIPHANFFSCSIPSITTFDSASSVEVVK